VILDRSAFYPEGGGQPGDRGTLAGVPVEDTQERDGEVLHLLAVPLPSAAGGTVHGTVRGAVDPGRRRDFRQQHTGQHVLSAALLSAAGARTISANLGEEFTSVEVEAAALSGQAIAAAEEEANRIVCRNHPVVIHWVAPEEAARFPLRKAPPPGKERLRIVEIPGVDASACGGLHVSSTGEVGLILFSYQEKIRGRTRLHWKIGGRAWRELRERERILGELAHELTCGIGDLTAVARSLKARLKAQEAVAAQAGEQLAGLLAERLLAAAPAIGAWRLVQHRLSEGGPGQLTALFQALAAAPGTVVCLAADAPASGSAHSARWLVGSSADLDLPLGDLIAPLLPSIEGKGGGRSRLLQGTALRPEGWAEFCGGFTAALAKRV
jgi:alanyl-tRNA synthetase